MPLLAAAHTATHRSEGPSKYLGPRAEPRRLDADERMGGALVPVRTLWYLTSRQFPQPLTWQVFHLKWTVKAEYVDALVESGKVRSGQILNHFRRNYELMTKHGLSRNLRSLPLFEDCEPVA